MDIGRYNRVSFVLGLIMLMPTVHAQDCKEVDIALVIDSSGSIDENGDSWERMKSFTQELVNRLDVGSTRVRVGAVIYSSTASVQFYLNTYTRKSDMISRLGQMPFLGTKTYTGLGLRYMRQEIFQQAGGDRGDVTNVAIVITDGKSNVDVDETKAEADIAKNVGIRMIAVGITDQINPRELRSIASDDNALFTVDTFDVLMDRLDDIIRIACQDLGNNEKVCQKGADIALVLDQSQSIVFSSEGNWPNKMLAFAVSIVEAFPIASDLARFGVIKFSDTAEVVITLDEFNEETSLVTAIENLERVGVSTNTADGLRRARLELFRPDIGDRDDVPNILILVTDGRSTVNAGDTIPEANSAKNDGIEIFTIGIQDIDETELKNIASNPDDTHYFYVSEIDELRSVLSNIIYEVCEAIDNPATTGTSSQSSSTSASTTLSTPESTVSTPSTPSTSPSTPSTPRTSTTDSLISLTITPLPDIECLGSDVDFIVALDASGSINDLNFMKMLDFVKNVIKRLDIASGKVRVSTLKFSNEPHIEFFLNEYTSVTQMMTAIDRMQYIRGSTNTAKTLEYIRSSVFSQQNGDRIGTRDILLLLTDGNSDDTVATLEQAKLLRSDGVHVIVIGIGNWYDVYELQALSSYPYQKNMIPVSGFDDLEGQSATIVNAICNNVDQCVQNRSPCLNGGNCISNSLDYQCICQPGYGGKNCDTSCAQAGDVIFALDASGSIGKDNFQKMTDFVTTVVQSMDISNRNSEILGTRIGLLTYGNNAEFKFNLNDNLLSDSELLNSLNVRFTDGTTNTADVIRYARENMFIKSAGDRPQVQNYLVVMTDGKSNDPEDTWQQAMLARDQGITVMSVGIGTGFNQEELEGMASSPISSNVITARDFDSLSNKIMQSMSEALCNNKDNCMPNPCENGATCTDLIGGYSCGPCPSSFTGFNCERGCSGEIDLIFVLDSSGSIRVERYPDVLDFIAKIVSNLDIGPSRTRVGLIYWSNDAYTHFTLNQYTRREDVIQAIKRTPFLGGRTHTSSALEMLYTSGFTSQSGERIDASNIAVIITDGNSNIEPERTPEEAIIARTAGMHIMSVAVGTTFVNYGELEGIVSAPSDRNIFNVASYDDLNSIVETLVMSTCDDVDECSSNPCQNNGRCIDGLRSYTCLCENNFAGINCERLCSRRLDLVFVLDLSGSVEEEYRLVVNFARAVTYGLNIDSDLVRIGAVTYATDVTDQFSLNTYSGSKISVVNALNFYHEGGRTNTQEALSTALQHFSPARGDRAGVQNVVVLVTDGYSNVNQDNTVPNALALQDEGIDVYSVAIGEFPNSLELSDISSNPDTEYLFRLRHLAEVEAVADTLLQRLCE